MSNQYTVANSTERAHLVHLVQQLSDEQLHQQVNPNWSVAGVLAHLAFWDRRAFTLLTQWQQTGIAPSPIDTHVVNEAMREHCLLIPPQAAIELAVSSADAIDNLIEALSHEMLAEVESEGKAVHLDRAVHRSLHLGQIEQALGLAGRYT